MNVPKNVTISITTETLMDEAGALSGSCEGGKKLR